MILSMTGYGHGRAANADYAAAVELKSVNAKFVEVALKLPRGYFAQELELRNLLSQRLLRGKISASVTVTPVGAQAAAALGSLPLDVPLLQRYYAEFDTLRRQLGSQAEPPLQALLALPGVVQEAEREVPEAEWAVVRQALDHAVEALQRSRATEGAALAADLRQRVDAIADGLARILPFDAERTQAVRDRLHAAVAELHAQTGTQVAPERFEQELLFYLERNDINEERVRLAAHLALFRDTLAEPDSQGRKLGFVAQEMGREINTLGAKAYHAGIQSLIVQMKDELEKIKEQVANIV